MDKGERGADIHVNSIISYPGKSGVSFPFGGLWAPFSSEQSGGAF